MAETFKFGDEQEKSAKEEIRQTLVQLKNFLKKQEEKVRQASEAPIQEPNKTKERI